MAAYGSRWYPIHCGECGYEHGFTAGALVILVNRADQFVTVSGGRTCLIKAIADHTPRSTDPRFAYAERVY